MEKIINISNIINGIQYTHFNWKYFLSISFFLYEYQVYLVILLSVVVAR